MASGPGTLTSTNISFQNQLSGYLLRKFKNSSGWQKLWVVFTNFCLFFYKTHQVGGAPPVGAVPSRNRLWVGRGWAPTE